MKTVEELDVFKLSHSLALEIFESTKAFLNPPSSPLNLRGGIERGYKIEMPPMRKLEEL
jgi:hypothetical protein